MFGHDYVPEQLEAMLVTGRVQLSNQNLLRPRIVETREASKATESY
jgi:hypothetical protein